MTLNAYATELQLVDEGDGTLKYLVAETDEDPWVAQDIHRLLTDTGDVESADIFLLTPDMQMIPVCVDHTDGEDYLHWQVTLGAEPGGDLLERVEYSAVQTDGTGNQTDSHVQHVDGWGAES